jgi:hypothetical protein
MPARQEPPARAEKWEASAHLPTYFPLSTSYF